jgi:thioester reductase-like protein
METTANAGRRAKGTAPRLSVHLTADTTALVRKVQAAETDRLRREAPETTYVDELLAQAARAMLADTQQVAFGLAECGGEL